jgi:hypothetical protein
MRFFTIILLLLACSSNDPVAIPLVSDYFPLKKGAYQVYSVDSIVIAQNVEAPYHYEIMTSVTDSFPNGDGHFTYVMQRSKRLTAASAWTSVGSWSARVNKFQAVVNEGNISYLKMASPMGNGKAWDGNVLNILGGTEKCLDRDSFACDIYTMEAFAQPFPAPPGQPFDNTVTIVQNDNKDLIVALDKRSEVYALKTGLVYREIIRLKYCTDQDCVGTQFVDSGLKYFQTISAYGGL